MSHRLPLLTNHFWRVPKGQVIWWPQGADRPSLLGDVASFEILVEEQVLDLRSHEAGVGVLRHQMPLNRDVRGRLCLRQTTERALEVAFAGALAIPARIAQPGQAAVLDQPRAGQVFGLGHRGVVVGSLTQAGEVLIAGQHYLADGAAGLIGLLDLPGAGDVEVAFDVAGPAADDLPAMGIAAAGGRIGRLILLGTQGVGPRLDVDLPLVRLVPAQSVPLIGSTEIAGIVLEFTALFDPTQPGEHGYGSVWLMDDFAPALERAHG